LIDRVIQIGNGMPSRYRPPASAPAHAAAAAKRSQSNAKMMVIAGALPIAFFESEMTLSTPWHHSG
jgi:hypothetical protein